MDKESYIYVGAIDPGKTGAFAIQDLRSGNSNVFDCPLKNDKTDVKGIVKLINYFRGAAIAIEYVNGHGKGGMGGCNFCFNYAAWITAMEAAGITYIIVTPQVWKSRLGLIKKSKADSLAKARVLFPSMEEYLKRQKDHDRAEALLLMSYVKNLWGLGQKTN